MKNLGGKTTSVVAILIAVSPLVFPQDASLQKRVTPAEAESLLKATAGVGTSGLPAVTTTVLFGDPAKAGLYSIQLKVAPNTIIKAHTHRDTRTATVVSGAWYFGYGPKNEPSALKLLGAGSFYTEPAGQAHFARTTAEGAVVIITGYGPSDTTYVEK
jgi:quercetin dioxygenase-like cupin family protein